MPEPVLHVIAGSNGAGKSSFYERVLAPSTLEFVNADTIAAEQWPGDEATHAYEAAQLAAERREELLSARRSFVTETVFSHESKVKLIRLASQSGYFVMLHVIIVPETLAVARVQERVAHGGHSVPEDKIRSRHQRLWGHLVNAIPIANETRVYDNSLARQPFRTVAIFRNGVLVRRLHWPSWVPPELTAISS